VRNKIYLTHLTIRPITQIYYKLINFKILLFDRQGKGNMYRLQLSTNANGMTDWLTEYLPDCMNSCPPINNYVLEIHNT